MLVLSFVASFARLPVQPLVSFNLVYWVWCCMNGYVTYIGSPFDKFTDLHTRNKPFTIILPVVKLFILSSYQSSRSLLYVESHGAGDRSESRTWAQINVGTNTLLLTGTSKNEVLIRGLYLSDDVERNG